MDPHSRSSLPSSSHLLNKKRHALMGTASALGLLLLPLTGSLVVAGVTAASGPHAVAIATQEAGPPNIAAAQPIPFVEAQLRPRPEAAPVTVPPVQGHGGRSAGVMR
jgi:hypothetical protein